MSKLKVNNFQERINIPQKEHEVISFWKETQAFERSVSERKEDNRYVFYDGPPFATGLPHYGHILASTVKDVVPRYWTMKGFRVERVWGWDCHGIPIENMIEKELDLKGGKKGIEEMGIGKFNAACRAAILRFDKEWEKVIERIGRWVDFKNSYKTMDVSFMESVWWAFKELHGKGLVYEGRRVILYCPRCATPLSNFEIAMDNSYRDLPGPSTTYKYKLKNQPNTYLLAWSTTPWNKLATPALAVNPEFNYIKVQQGDEFYILAENTQKMLKGDFNIVENFKGKDLEQFQFEMHYSFYSPKVGEKIGVIIADSYVTDTEGTGVVTLAVYGEDDYRIMTKNGVQLIEHVDSEGKLKPEVVPWQGMFMLKVNPLVNEDLRIRGLIYHNEERIHSVPVCYRCETRLYQAPVPAWFINIQKMKPQMVLQNENINWYPKHLKKGRFGKGLETAPDWNISRSRYWGTPMPIWQNGKHMRIIGSIQQLQQWAVDKNQVANLTDIHREYLDEVEVWLDGAKTIKGRRIPEVFDCWIESGSMPYASIHYPFENKESFQHPAQFIAEYIAQTRAWFYTLHVMSVGLFDKHTFENAVTTGTILAEDGTKMSKSKKNYPDPVILLEKYGADALRFYLMSSVVMKGENLNFSEAQVRETYQKIISLLWNTFSFYKLYAKDAANGDLPKLVHDLDIWIVSKTQGLIQSVTESMDIYDTQSSCRTIQEFIDDLSTWYLRRSRERFKQEPASMQVFGWVLLQLVKVMAPFTPFVTELIYQNLVDTKDSIHLEIWPNFDKKMINQDLEQKMKHAREIVEKGHAFRQLHNLPLKQPLKKALVKNATLDVSGLGKILTQELNVLEIDLTRGDGELVVEFDTEITPELELERKVREYIRKVQQLRKEKGLKVDERINLVLPKDLQSLPKALLSRLQLETLADNLSWADELSISIG